MPADPTNDAEQRIIPLAPRAVSQMTPPATAARSFVRRRALLLSFLLCVLAPSLTGAIYYGLIAADRYAVSTGFAVRGLTAPAGLDGIGTLTGLAGGSPMTSDSFMILQFLQSRDLVERVSSTQPLDRVFTHAAADRWARLPAEASIEDLVQHWGRFTKASFDATSGIINFEVQAFTPEDARQIAQAVLHHTNALIDRLSETARHDAVRFAMTETARAEDRLRNAMQAQRDSRAGLRMLDPTASVQGDIATLADLQTQLIDLRARIAAAASQLTADAPPLVALRRQADAVADQIAAQGAALATGPQGEVVAMSDQLALAEQLDMEKQFAQQSYGSALASLEQARAEADRQQRYLAVFAPPALPQDAVYPKRLENALLVLALSLVIWGIGTLIIYAVRDHAT